MPDSVTRTFFESGLVPVVVLTQAEKGAALARAIQAGGLNSMEITLRTSAALEAIRQTVCQVPDILVGAGTVHSVTMAQQAVEAGARFIVSPGLDRAVVGWCQERDIPVFPGVSTPTELEAALELGLTAVKFFPAEQSGGVAMLRALASPYQGIQFMPTGGIRLENLSQYLRLPNVLACGGSWMCPGHLIEQGGFDEITDLCRKAVKTVHRFQILRLILPAEDTCPIPICLEDVLEAGQRKKLVLGVNHVARALAVLERLGYARIPGGSENMVSDHDGRLILELVAL